MMRTCLRILGAAVALAPLAMWALVVGLERFGVAIAAVGIGGWLAWIG